jgi:hypothetical protein
MSAKVAWTIVGMIMFAAMWLTVALFMLTLIYGVIVIIFRYAFGVELWNPFHG